MLFIKNIKFKEKYLVIMNINKFNFYLAIFLNDYKTKKFFLFIIYIKFMNVREVDERKI